MNTVAFELDISNPVEFPDLNSGTFIFIHRAGKIPPHIGMISGGIIFEITTHGPGFEQKGTDLLKSAIKRKIEMLFVELILPKNTQNSAPEKLKKWVRTHQKVSNETSCLYPIRDFIQETFDLSLNTDIFIFDLLPILKNKKLIKSTYQLNLEEKIKNGKFQFVRYTKKEVQQNIEAVKRVKILASNV